MSRKYKGKEYQVRDYDCKKCKSFLPFSGNGRYICRLYEMGRCPEKQTKEQKDV